MAKKRKATPDPSAKAQQLHRSGNLQAAERAYMALLAKRPKHLSAHHGLGLVYLQGGALQPALDCFHHCLAIDPNHGPSHNYTGVVLKRMGDLSAALAAFERAAQLNPDLAIAHANIGDTYQDMGDSQRAVNAYQAALNIDPNLVAALHNMGLALKALGHLEAAVTAYRKVLVIKPGLSVALSNLGNALLDLGNMDEAKAALLQATQADPANAEALNNLATLMLTEGRFGAALAACKQALAARPDQPHLLANLTAALLALEQAPEAEASARRLLAVAPGFALAHTRLGLALRDQGRLSEAADALTQAVNDDPDDRQAREFLMHTCRQLCDWPRLADAEQALFKWLTTHPKEGVAPLALMCADGAEQAINMGPRLLANARAFVTRTVPVPQGNLLTFPKPGHPAAPPRLTIGYLSADLGQHAVGSLVSELFAGHDRKKFRIIGLPITPSDGSPTADKIRATFDQVVELSGMGSQDAARAIHAAEVDILVDLMGHTRHSRMDVLAHRPAPIQVNMLGFPGTSGADFMDYIVMDPVLAPTRADGDYSEAILRLPDSYFPTGAELEVGPAPSRKEAGLPDHGFVFCCFNDTYKITAPLFALWMDLLNAVPDSVLWLRHASDPVQANLRQAAGGHGVEGARLIFAPRLDQHRDHLARQRCADLFLDTRPYNAHTTTSDALWAGLPVITCPGNTFAARVAASLLTALGMPELIATDLDQYRQLALDLATDPARLANINAKLAQQIDSAPLFNPDRYRRHLEAGFEAIWQRHQNGLPARPIWVAPIN